MVFSKSCLASENAVEYEISGRGEFLDWKHNAKIKLDKLMNLKTAKQLFFPSFNIYYDKASFFE